MFIVSIRVTLPVTTPTGGIGRLAFKECHGLGAAYVVRYGLRSLTITVVYVSREHIADSSIYSVML
jgi:hypothetical protein